MDSFVTKTKLFHSFIRNKKVGSPMICPLKKDFGEVCSSNKEMVKQFTNAFSPVLSSDVPNLSAAHQCFVN